MTMVILSLSCNAATIKVKNLCSVENKVLEIIWKMSQSYGKSDELRERNRGVTSLPLHI